jgi:hypothetical protein
VGSGDVVVNHCGDHSGMCVKSCVLEDEVKILRAWKNEFEKKQAERELEDAKTELKKEADLKIIRAASKNNLISQILSALAILATLTTIYFAR